MHAVGSPVSLVLPLVGPYVDAEAMNLVVLELSRVRLAVRPFELAEAMLLTVLEVALELGRFVPDFYPVPVLDVF